MHEFGGEKAGRTFLLDRRKLIEQLEQLAVPGELHPSQVRRQQKEAVGFSFPDVRTPSAAGPPLCLPRSKSGPAISPSKMPASPISVRNCGSSSKPARTIPRASKRCWKEPSKMPEEALATVNTEAENKQREEEKNPQGPAYRFPTVEPKTAQFTLQLPPFPNAPEGFSGSLDELLEGLRAEALPLDVLPLAPLVDQYVDYCERLAAEENPHERMSDFLPLAATLIHLKSRLLLPQEIAAPAPDQPSVGEEIVEEIRRAERRRREQQAAAERADVADDGPQRLTLLDLMVLLNDVRNSLRAPLAIPEEDLSMRDAMRRIRESLPENAAFAAEIYFGQCRTRRDQAAVFLALLELGRNRFLDCHQTEAFTPIWLQRTSEPESL
ncbi:MAG: segregation and condensation protein A [Bryobacteraceae bacterium]